MLVLVVLLLALVMIGLLIGGLVLNRQHRREDEGRAADRINGP